MPLFVFIFDEYYVSLFFYSFFLFSLEYNKIGVDGAKALGEALKQNTSLTSLRSPEREVCLKWGRGE